MGRSRMNANWWKGPLVFVSVGLSLIILATVIQISSNDTWRSALFLLIFIVGNVLSLVGLGRMKKAIRSGALLK